MPDAAADGARMLAEGAVSVARQLRGGGGRARTFATSAEVDVSFDFSAPTFTSVESVAVLFMWFRQLRPLGLISNAFGDLVQMLAAMLKDVLLFMVLFAVVLFGFSAVSKGLERGPVATPARLHSNARPVAHTHGACLTAVRPTTTLPGARAPDHPR